jgi:nucleotide-binding universal stress UspA family protein
MFRTILVPLDGSAFSEAALPWALGLSRRTHAALQLASVHEPVPSFAYDEWESAAWQWSEDYLRNVREQIRQRTEGEVHAWVGTGRVVELLMSRADSTEADLVVMATHGRGALTRAWLGSVADGFVRHAHQPILLVRPDDDHPDPTVEPEVQRIVVPLDGSELSESVLDLAIGMAKLYGSQIRLLRVVAYPMEIASPYLPHTVQMNQKVVEEARDAARAYLERVAARITAEGVEATVHVTVDTQAGHAVAREVEELDAQLVVMATHGRGGLQRALLGSTTDKVIRAVHVPILVQRPESPEE